MIPTRKESIDPTALQIQAYANFEERQVLLGFSWQVLSFTRTKLEIQLKFEYPDQVSSDTEPD